MSLRRTSLKQLSEKMARIRSAYLLLAAAVFHVTLCVLINTVGRFNLLPYLFDANGISSPLAFDSFYYRQKSIQLVAALARGNVADWMNAPFPLHVKFYSLSFAVLSPLFGYTMLSAEPLNLIYYLSILVLVFKLGEETFDRRTGTLAALIVALWPSFLLHTTQLLRDPLFILVMLTMVLIGTRWLTREHSLLRGLLEALAGGASSAVIWLTRYNIWKLLICFMLLGAALLIIRQLRERRLLAGNLAGAVLLLVMMSGVPTIVGMLQLPDSSISEYPIEKLVLPPSPCPRESSPSADAITEQSSVWSRLLAKADAAVARVGELRLAFVRAYPNAGSNIDMCAKLDSVSDLLRYLPRAMANGFFAPYPDMWLNAGSTTGRYGRLLSGLEMLGLYLIELLAIIGLWSGRRRLSVWFVAVIAATSIIALGLVVLNVAILFRLRYVFCILLIILGAEGARRILSLWELKGKDERMAMLDE